MEVVVPETHQSYVVAADSDVGNLRRAVQAKAFEFGLDNESIGKTAIVASELATNLIKHTKSGGEVLLKGFKSSNRQGLEIIALDKGTGVKSVYLNDGESTSATLGVGLGAIRRLSDQVDMHTDSEMGTAILARFWAKSRALSTQESSAPASLFEFGGVMVPYPGENVCGDGWAVADCGTKFVVVMLDGLGHGPLAGQAAQRALNEFKQFNNASVSSLIDKMQEGMRGTRGAVLALAVIDRSAGLVHYAGIGNICGRIASSSKSVSCVSMGGTAGLRVPAKVREFTYSWVEDSVLFMNSDGLRTGFYARDLSTLSQCDPALAAGILYRDFARRNDDASVLIVSNAGRE